MGKAISYVIFGLVLSIVLWELFGADPPNEQMYSEGDIVYLVVNGERAQIVAVYTFAEGCKIRLAREPLITMSVEGHEITRDPPKEGERNGQTK